MSGARAFEGAEAELRAQIAELTRELESERAARQARERALLEAVDSEQQRLAQLLHDTSSQSLSAARIYARVTRDVVHRISPEAATAVMRLEQVLQTAADELQALMRWLRPARLDGLELIAALEDLSQLASRTMPCEFRCPATTIDADVESQAELLRIAQLALHTSMRRSSGQTMACVLQVDARHLVLEMRASWQRPLPGDLEELLAERARVMDGSFTVQDERGPGCTLTCRLPKRRGAERGGQSAPIRAAAPYSSTGRR